MKPLFYTEQVATSFFLLVFLLLFSAPLYGAEFKEEVSTEGHLFIKGIVRSVSPEDLTVKIKQKKGGSITVSIDRDTTLEGFYKLEELKPRQKVKVWYRPDQSKNTALKILRPLELGC